MKRTLAAATLSLGLFGGAPRDGRAEPPPSRSVFALVITNNRSADLSRPDLRYADDDGVKYAELFRTIAPPQSVHLLTELDRDTELLYPHLAGTTHAPTKAEVLTAATAIAEDVKKAREQGRDVDFYFVFAGHGDVDRGKGFLGLKDGRFTSDDVEALLRKIPSTRSHVILDSCNSYFVLNARKPGGRRVALEADAVHRIPERLPHVGVFLSTSAEAEVFEWSELQSGIFSHAVRSGLLGAADADHDGVVTYDELRAFVGVSTSKVRNPLYRPRVFARGPNARAGEPLFPLRRAEGKRVEIDAAAPVRLTVRDGDGLPWIDVHKEQGAPVTLLLPGRIAARATIDEREVKERGGRVLRRYALGGGEAGDPPIRLAALTPTPPVSAPRGSDEALRLLFAAPFGPRAKAEHDALVAKDDEPVYGVSRDDAERMRLLLGHVSDIEKRGRQSNGVLFGVSGAALLGVGIAERVYAGDSTVGQVTSYLTMGIGALTLGGGLFALLRRSEGERLYDAYVTGMATAGPLEASKLVARTELSLHALARSYRRARWAAFGVGTAVSVLSTLALVGYATTGDHSLPVAVDLLPFGIGAGAAAALMSFIPTPVERIVELWSTDPGLTRLPRPTLSLTPLAGGAVLGLTGTF